MAGFVNATNASTQTTSNATESATTSLGLLVVSACQIVFGVVGMLGNSLCFFVLRRQSEKNHTNWLIVNQCAADFLVSCQLIAAAVHFNWFYSGPDGGGLAGQLFCRLWDSRVLLFAGFAISTFNLTAISVERYVAVVHPMVYMTRFKRRTLYVFAATAWILGPFLQAVLAATHFEYRDNSCHYIPSGPAVGVGLFIWEYFIPVIIMGYAFVRIALKLRSLNRIGNASSDVETSSKFPGSRSTRMVGAESTAVIQASSAGEPSAMTSGNDNANEQGAGNCRSLRRVGDASNDLEATADAPTQSAIQSISAGKYVSKNVASVHVNDSGIGEGPSNSKDSKQPAAKSENAAGNVRRRNITITLLIIYVTYLICWTPNQFVFLVFNFGVLPGYIGSTGHVITTILATLNTCINPIVYAFKYKAFRRGLRDLFSKCFGGNSS